MQATVEAARVDTVFADDQVAVVRLEVDHAAGFRKTIGGNDVEGAVVGEAHVDEQNFAWCAVVGREHERNITNLIDMELGAVGRSEGHRLVDRSEV